MTTRTVIRAARSAAPAAAMAALLLSPAAAPLSAQLRPLEPVDWAVFEQGRVAAAAVGFGLYPDQRASLAGTEGRLLEVGNFTVVWRRGAAAFEASGTVLRVFEDDVVFAQPTGGARPSSGGRRLDSGDYRVSTAIRLTDPDARDGAVLRFGTRLPTTDNRVGLDRDQTDFFATLAGRLRRGAVTLTAEAGVGIFGTRIVEFEQSDVLIYALGAEYRGALLTPSFALLGQTDGGHDRVLRGNENLSELRLALRAGQDRWLQLGFVKGLTAFSPGAGLRLTAGFLHGGQPRR